ncbi:hypothetical protein Tco_0680467, partial [Tanacetum coccineum]
SPSEHPDKKRNLNTFAKLARAKSDKYSEEVDMSKDTSSLESPKELQRDCCFPHLHSLEQASTVE